MKPKPHCKKNPEWNGRGKLLLIIWTILNIIALIIYFRYFTGDVE